MPIVAAAYGPDEHERWKANMLDTLPGTLSAEAERLLAQINPADVSHRADVLKRVPKAPTIEAARLIAGIDPKDPNLKERIDQICDCLYSKAIRITPQPEDFGLSQVRIEAIAKQNRVRNDRIFKITALTTLLIIVAVASQAGSMSDAFMVLFIAALGPALLIAFLVYIILSVLWPKQIHPEYAAYLKAIADYKVNLSEWVRRQK